MMSLRAVPFRTKLTLWWTLGVGVLLLAANLAIYGAFRGYLRDDFDRKVRTVAATELASSTDGAEIHLHELPAQALAEGEYSDKFVQILTADGRVRLFSASLRGLPALVSAGVLQTALAGHAPLVSVAVGARSARAAVLTASKRGQQYVVLVGMFGDDIDAHLARLAWLLVAVWVAGVGGTAALGYWLASAALAPVVAITSRAARIARGEFSARLDPPATGDEVGRMTRALNEVLERLHGALEANRRFASDASHELRAPIAAMSGEVDVTLRQTRSVEDYRSAMLVVRERLAALTALIEDLTLLARAQEGAEGLEVREIAVLGQLQEGITRLTSDLAVRGITVEARDLPDLVAYAEPRLLARVFDNVLANAVRYNRDRGAVVIGGSGEDSAPAEWQTSMALITVTDTGPGIPPAESERVFERFYRLDHSRARQTGGSGLGLAICREVLTVLGGSIRIAASSAAGTTFEIRIPGRIASDRRFSQVLA